MDKDVVLVDDFVVEDEDLWKANPRDAVNALEDEESKAMPAPSAQIVDLFTLNIALFFPHRLEQCILLKLFL